jgi:hypothetical protein
MLQNLKVHCRVHKGKALLEKIIVAQLAKKFPT